MKSFTSGIIGLNSYSLHRRPDLCGLGAKLFRLERWTEKRPLEDHPRAEWAYLLFNGGRQVC